MCIFSVHCLHIVCLSLAGHPGVNVWIVQVVPLKSCESNRKVIHHCQYLQILSAVMGLHFLSCCFSSASALSDQPFHTLATHYSPILFCPSSYPLTLLCWDCILSNLFLVKESIQQGWFCYSGQRVKGLLKNLLQWLIKNLYLWELKMVFIGHKKLICYIIKF